MPVANAMGTRRTRSTDCHFQRQIAIKAGNRRKVAHRPTIRLVTIGVGVELCGPAQISGRQMGSYASPAMTKALAARFRECNASLFSGAYSCLTSNREQTPSLVHASFPIRVSERAQSVDATFAGCFYIDGLYRGC